MVIDCDTCAVRGDACRDCVVSVLLGPPAPLREQEPGSVTPSTAPTVQLDEPEERALQVLADEGLIPRLRLVAVEPRRTTVQPGTTETSRHAG
jgi:hypothetical protein